MPQGHDGARIENAGPYLLLGRQLGAVRVAVSYSRAFEFASGIHARGDNQEWLATFSIPHRLSERSLITPAFCVGHVRVQQVERTAIFWPRIEFSDEPGSSVALDVLLRDLFAARG